MIKLFASDLDGTLLNKQHGLSVIAIETIRQLQQQGIHFVPCTGRYVQNAREIFHQQNILCDMIVMNGALTVNHNDDALYEMSIASKDIKCILTKLKELNIDYFMSTECGIGSSNPDKLYEQMYTYWMLQNTKTDKKKIQEVKNLFTIDFCVDDVETFLNDQIKVHKIELFTNASKRTDEFKRFIEKIPTLNMTSSTPFNLEITHYCANKGYAVKQIANHYGIHNDEILVIGDNCNDISMLEMFPNSYAMENGHIKAKDAANFIAPSNQDDGAIKIMTKILSEVTK